MSAPLKLGADCWPQYTSWSAFIEAMLQAEDLGYDSLWTWDHLYPAIGSHEGPTLEPYMALAAVATKTSRATIGLMVGANTYRNPALVAKMITTIDHISGGRAILGIGSAWAEVEHRAYGIPFGDSPGERLRWLRAALPLIRGMLDGTRPSAAGDVYHARQVQNLPAPVQKHLPILIGGSGPRVTLRLVARYGDACNLGSTLASVREGEQLLVEHCEAIGREERVIERTAVMGVPIIRDSRAEAERVSERIFAANGNASRWSDQPTGTPEDIVEHCAPFLEIGYRHLIFYFPAPFDQETMTRLSQEVRQSLEALRTA